MSKMTRVVMFVWSDALRILKNLLARLTYNTHAGCANSFPVLQIDVFVVFFAVFLIVHLSTSQISTKTTLVFCGSNCQHPPDCAPPIG